MTLFRGNSMKKLIWLKGRRGYKTEMEGIKRQFLSSKQIGVALSISSCPPLQPPLCMYHLYFSSVRDTEICIFHNIPFCFSDSAWKECLWRSLGEILHACFDCTFYIHCPVFKLGEYQPIQAFYEN